MLKHVHTSPHRTGTLSFKVQKEDPLKYTHIRQSSSPSSITLSRSLDSSTVDSGILDSSTDLGIDISRGSCRNTSSPFESSSCYRNCNISYTTSSLQREKRNRKLYNNQCYSILNSSIDECSEELVLSSTPIKFGNCSLDSAVERVPQTKEIASQSSSPIPCSKEYYCSSSDSGNETESHISTPSQSYPLSSSDKLRLKSICNKKDTNERSRSSLSKDDTSSLDSSMSYISSSREDAIGSLSSSAVSLPETSKAIMVKIWVRCLMQEMEYKTISLSYHTTCREIVTQLLSKFKMKHRDPNLFYLTMEVTIRKAGTEVRTSLRLDDSSFPGQLIECHPREQSRLALRMSRGGLIRIYDKEVCEGSNYKSLLVSEDITCYEIKSLILSCNKIKENANKFALYEVWPESGKENVLESEDKPMLIANNWTDNTTVRFEMRRHSNNNPGLKSMTILNTSKTILNGENKDDIESCSSIPNNKLSLRFENDLKLTNSSNCKTERITTVLINGDDCIQQPQEVISTNSNTALSENIIISSCSSQILPEFSSSLESRKCDLVEDSGQNMDQEEETIQKNNIEARATCGDVEICIMSGASITGNSQQEIEEIKHSKSHIEFRTYNDYENYFYI